MSRPNRGRFTLVELAIVVGIIAVLAAVAIPLLVGYQNRSRRAEAFMNVKAMSDGAWMYLAENPSTPLFPGSTDLNNDGYFPRATTAVDRDAVAWNPTHATSTSIPLGYSAFDQLGFSPDGAVRCAYSFSAGPDPIAKVLTTTAYAWCDTDGDGLYFGVQRIMVDGKDISIGGKTTPSGFCSTAVASTCAPVGGACDCY